MTQPERMRTPDPARLPLAVTDAADFAASAAFRRWAQTSNRDAYVHAEIFRAARAAVEAAAPILLAAGRTAAAADLPTTTEEILAWLSRHGLSTTPGVGIVLAAVRADLIERGEPHAG